MILFGYVFIWERIHFTKQNIKQKYLVLFLHKISFYGLGYLHALAKCGSSTSSNTFRSQTSSVYSKFGVCGVWVSEGARELPEISRNNVHQTVAFKKRRSLHSPFTIGNTEYYLAGLQWLNGEKVTLVGLWRREPMRLMSTIGTGEI